jgi:hypothetical protein
MITNTLISLPIDITVELSTEGAHFLNDIDYLLLEVNLNGITIKKVDLLTKKSRHGVWDADQPIPMCASLV